MRDVVYSSATEMLRLIREREISVLELVDAHLAQIERLNPSLNAVIDLRAEAARAEARGKDVQLARNGDPGPLHGLPITIKGAINVAGLTCETGTPTRAGIVAEQDAPLVSRLRAAGAIVLGTTNVAEFLMAYDSDNPIYGRTNNPWALDRTPGGSSGGESAAIAACCSAGGIGSDGGGSIRVPAHFAGICGLKPTPGRVPATGHVPACTGPFALIGVVGPMGRTIEDVSRIFQVIAGPDPGDPCSAPVPAGALANPDRSAIRVAFFEDDGRTPVTRETRAAVGAAAGALRGAGFSVERMVPPELEQARAAWEIFFCQVGGMLLGETLKGAEWELPILHEYRRANNASAPLTAESFIHAWLDRDQVRADLLRRMAGFPVLLSPVAAVPAFRHGERAWQVEGQPVSYLDAMSYTVWSNILGNPAAVVPVGRSPEGLPIGVQVIGRPYEEETVLSVAALIERECGGWRRPPVS